MGAWGSAYMVFRMREFTLVLLLASCASIACGCGTFNNIVGAGTLPADPLIEQGPPNEIFGGVREDAEYAFSAFHPSMFAASASGQFGHLGLLAQCLGLCALADLPFSTVGDIVTLPITIPAELKRRREITESRVTLSDSR